MQVFQAKKTMFMHYITLIFSSLLPLCLIIAQNPDISNGTILPISAKRLRKMGIRLRAEEMKTADETADGIPPNGLRRQDSVDQLVDSLTEQLQSSGVDLSSLEADLDAITCMICCDEFTPAAPQGDDADSRPAITNCGHNICVSCKNGWRGRTVNGRLIPHTDHVGREKRYECPVCKKGWNRSLVPTFDSGKTHMVDLILQRNENLDKLKQSIETQSQQGTATRAAITSKILEHRRKKQQEQAERERKEREERESKEREDRARAERDAERARNAEEERREAARKAAEDRATRVEEERAARAAAAKRRRQAKEEERRRRTEAIASNPEALADMFDGPDCEDFGDDVYLRQPAIATGPGSGPNAASATENARAADASIDSSSAAQPGASGPEAQPAAETGVPAPTAAPAAAEIDSEETGGPTPAVIANMEPGSSSTANAAAPQQPPAGAEESGDANGESAPGAVTVNADDDNTTTQNETTSTNNRPPPPFTYPWDRQTGCWAWLKKKCSCLRGGEAAQPNNRYISYPARGEPHPAYMTSQERAAARARAARSAGGANAVIRGDQQLAIRRQEIEAALRQQPSTQANAGARTTGGPTNGTNGLSADGQSSYV